MTHDITVHIYHKHLLAGVPVMGPTSDGLSWPQITLPRLGVTKRNWWQFSSINRSRRTSENLTEVSQRVFTGASVLLSMCERTNLSNQELIHALSITLLFMPNISEGGKSGEGRGFPVW